MANGCSVAGKVYSSGSLVLRLCNNSLGIFVCIKHDKLSQYQRLCLVLVTKEANDASDFFMTLEKDPQQEDFLQGRMLGNPYNSNEPGLGPLMRDVKNKICQGELHYCRLYNVVFGLLELSDTVPLCSTVDCFHDFASHVRLLHDLLSLIMMVQVFCSQCY